MKTKRLLLGFLLVAALPLTPPATSAAGISFKKSPRAAEDPVLDLASAADPLPAPVPGVPRRTLLLPRLQLEGISNAPALTSRLDAHLRDLLLQSGRFNLARDAAAAPDGWEVEVRVIQLSVEQSLGRNGGGIVDVFLKNLFKDGLPKDLGNVVVAHERNRVEVACELTLTFFAGGVSVGGGRGHVSGQISARDLRIMLGAADNPLVNHDDRRPVVIELANVQSRVIEKALRTAYLQALPGLDAGLAAAPASPAPAGPPAVAEVRPAPPAPPVNPPAVPANPAAAWLTPRQVAERLTVGEEDVLAEVKAGRLKATRVGSQIRISEDALAEFLKGTAPLIAGKDGDGK